MEQAKNVEVMRDKRRQHAQVIDARQRERQHRKAAARLGGAAAQPSSGGFQEAGFFVPSVPGTRDDDVDYAVHDARAGAHHALSAAVMDMEQDDNEALNAQRNAYHWDKRKKRYLVLKSRSVFVCRMISHRENTTGMSSCSLMRRSRRASVCARGVMDSPARPARVARIRLARCMASGLPGTSCRWGGGGRRLAALGWQHRTCKTGAQCCHEVG